MADTKDKIKDGIDDTARKAKDVAGKAVDKTKEAAREAAGRRIAKGLATPVTGLDVGPVRVRALFRGGLRFGEFRSKMAGYNV